MAHTGKGRTYDGDGPLDRKLFHAVNKGYSTAIEYDAVGEPSGITLRTEYGSLKATVRGGSMMIEGGKDNLERLFDLELAEEGVRTHFGDGFDLPVSDILYAYDDGLDRDDPYGY